MRAFIKGLLQRMRRRKRASFVAAASPGKRRRSFINATQLYQSRACGVRGRHPSLLRRAAPRTRLTVGCGLLASGPVGRALEPSGRRRWPASTRKPAMSRRHAPAPNDLRAFWMPFTANRQFKQAPRMFVAAEGMHYTTSDGRTRARRHGGALVLQRRALPAEDLGGDRRAGGGDGLCAGVPDGASEGVRAGEPADRDRAGGNGACVLHQLRVGERRDGAEDRHRLSAGDRPGDADPADRARARLSRGELRRDLGRRDRLRTASSSGRC